MATTPGFVKPGILPHQSILQLCGLRDSGLEESTGQGPIRPCRRKNVRSASYDLRLGTHFHFAKSPPDGGDDGVVSLKISSLEKDRDEHIVIPPNQVVVVSSLEKVYLAEDMIGHITLKQDILLQGLIMAGQSQVDAGYEGWIYALLYNLTSAEVVLRLDQSVLRLELVRLPEATARVYDGDYQNASLAKSVQRPIGSSLSALRREVEKRGKEVDEERKRVSRTRLMIYGFSALAVAAPILFALAFGLLGDVARLEGQIAPSKEALQIQDRKVQDLQSRVSALQCQILEQEGKPKPIRC